MHVTSHTNIKVMKIPKGFSGRALGLCGLRGRCRCRLGLQQRGVADVATALRAGRLEHPRPESAAVAVPRSAACLTQQSYGTTSRVHPPAAPVCVGRTFGILAPQQIEPRHLRTVL